MVQRNWTWACSSCSRALPPMLACHILICRWPDVALAQRFASIDSQRSEAIDYDEDAIKTAFYNLPAYLTRHYPDVLAAMQVRVCARVPGEGHARTDVRTAGAWARACTGLPL